MELPSPRHPEPAAAVSMQSVNPPFRVVAGDDHGRIGKTCPQDHLSLRKRAACLPLQLLIPQSQAQTQHPVP